jgi:ABC-type transporter Mla subunit MlaD
VTASLSPAPSTTLLLFNSQQWNWIVNTLTSIYTADELQLEAALDANTAATDAAVTAINAEIQQLADAIAALSTGAPPTQAQLDQLNAATQALKDATGALAADDTTP